MKKIPYPKKKNCFDTSKFHVRNRGMRKKRDSCTIDPSYINKLKLKYRKKFLLNYRFFLYLRGDTNCLMF